MPDWFLYAACAFHFTGGLYLGYLIGWKRGNALCPNDYVLRDVARQRDRMMCERDEAQRLAQFYFGALQHVTKAIQNEERPN
jgi:hypothetical protein